MWFFSSQAIKILGIGQHKFDYFYTILFRKITEMSFKPNNYLYSKYIKKKLIFYISIAHAI